MNMLKNQHKQRGTIFFVVVISLMILTMIMHCCFRNVSYAISLAREREKSEQHYYLAYSLYRFIVSHYSDQCNKNEKIKNNIFMGPWPYNDSTYKGLVWTEYKKDTKILYVELEQNKKRVITLSFLI